MALAKIDRREYAQHGVITSTRCASMIETTCRRHRPIW
jgi:hypothetical protein